MKPLMFTEIEHKVLIEDPEVHSSQDAGDNKSRMILRLLTANVNCEYFCIILETPWWRAMRGAFGALSPRSLQN